MDNRQDFTKQETELEQLLHDTGHLWYVDVFAEQTKNLPFAEVYEQFKALLAQWFIDPVYISRSEPLLKRSRDKFLSTVIASQQKKIATGSIPSVKISTRDIKDLLRKITLSDN
jgi:hypothetical protein